METVKALRISDFGFRIEISRLRFDSIRNPQSAIRNSKQSEIQ
jgi:hypothetical protein